MQSTSHARSTREPVREGFEPSIAFWATARVEHLKAALEVWRYCEDSARWIFETRTGDKNADRILAALKVAGEKGMTKWEINSDVFNRHATRFEIDEALRVLYHAGLAYRKEEKTKTRPAERWFYQATAREGCEESPKGADTSHSSPPLASENASSTTPTAGQVPVPSTVGPEAVESGVSGDSVPVMITKAMEAQLKQRGLTQADIDKLTPQQAHEILAAPAAPVAGVVVDEKGVGEL